MQGMLGRFPGRRAGEANVRSSAASDSSCSNFSVPASINMVDPLPVM
jgi:hypothetical protein